MVEIVESGRTKGLNYENMHISDPYDQQRGKKDIVNGAIYATN